MIIPAGQWLVVDVGNDATGRHHVTGLYEVLTAFDMDRYLASCGPLTHDATTDQDRRDVSMSVIYSLEERGYLRAVPWVLCAMDAFHARISYRQATTILGTGWTSTLVPVETAPASP